MGFLLIGCRIIAARLGTTGTTAALVAILLAYANGSALWSVRGGRKIDLLSLNWAHLAMLALMGLWSQGERVAQHELGVGRSGIVRHSVVGLVLGLIASSPIVWFSSWGPVRRRSPVPPEFHGLRAGQICRLLLGQSLVGSALFEEFAFRGLLQAKLTRHVGTAHAILLQGVVFAAWHAVISWCNLRRAGIGRRAAVPLWFCGQGLMFLVGVGLGALRRRSGHLAGCIAVHWTLLATTTIVLVRRAGRGSHGEVRSEK